MASCSDVAKVEDCNLGRNIERRCYTLRVKADWRDKLYRFCKVVRRAKVDVRRYINEKSAPFLALMRPGVDHVCTSSSRRPNFLARCHRRCVMTPDGQV